MVHQCLQVLSSSPSSDSWRKNRINRLKPSLHLDLDWLFWLIPLPLFSSHSPLFGQSSSSSWSSCWASTVRSVHPLIIANKCPPNDHFRPSLWVPLFCPLLQLSFSCFSCWFGAWSKLKLSFWSSRLNDPHDDRYAFTLENGWLMQHYSSVRWKGS